MKISVIIPVYKVEQYLAQCVDSVLNQTYRDLEVILVDDGSPDRCPQMCDDYAAKDPRVRVIHQKNGGLSAARETGINAVTGEYAMFVDGDDWLDQETVSLCVRRIVEYPEIDSVLFSYMKELNGKSIPMHVMDGDHILMDNQAIDCVHRRLFGLANAELGYPERLENLCTCWGKLYRRDIARKGRYFKTEEVGSCEDGLFNIYALYGCKSVYYLDQPLYHYRKHNSSLTASYRPAFVQQRNRLFDIMEQFIEEHHLDQRYSEALQNRIALSITAVSLNELYNKSSSLQRICAIRQYLQSKRYHNAAVSLKISQLPLAWKGLLLCSRLKLAIPVYCGALLIAAKIRKD